MLCSAPLRAPVCIHKALLYLVLPAEATPSTELSYERPQVWEEPLGTDLVVKGVTLQQEGKK